MYCDKQYLLTTTIPRGDHMEDKTVRPNHYLIVGYLIGVLLVSALILKVILWMDGVK